MYDLLKDYQDQLRQLVIYVMVKIQDPSSFDPKKNTFNTLNEINREFEKIIFRFENKKIHKLALYALMKCQADIFFEMEEYNFAIKCFKSLKNFTYKW